VCTVRVAGREVVRVWVRVLVVRVAGAVRVLVERVAGAVRVLVVRVAGAERVGVVVGAERVVLERVAGADRVDAGAVRVDAAAVRVDAGAVRVDAARLSGCDRDDDALGAPFLVERWTVVCRAVVVRPLGVVRLTLVWVPRVVVLFRFNALPSSAASSSTNKSRVVSSPTVVPARAFVDSPKRARVKSAGCSG
jgi:hypothetical protein